jgi:NTE family protein
MLTVSKHRTLWILQALVFVSLTFSVALNGQETEHPRKRIGLALSGGGALGAAHIGVLKVLEKEGIKIDYIAGTSFGAIVGGLYATGYSADEIETLLLNHWQEVFSNQAVRARAPLMQNQILRQLVRLDMEGFKPSLPRGILWGQHLIELLSRLTLEPMLAADYDFDRLPIPFRAVATNLLTGEPYIFKSGRLSEAVNASMALPVFFSPVERDGLVLVDGGLADNLPADIVKAMGADFVIAVDATLPESTHAAVPNLLNVMQLSIGLRMKSTTKPNYQYATKPVIRPNLDGYSNTSYEHMSEIIELGIEEANSRIGEIREKVGKANLGESKKIRPYVLNPVIDSVTFETASPARSKKISSSFLLRQVKSRPGDKIIAESLNADVERLHATGMFDRVDYECRHVVDNRYSLVFLLTESSPNNLGMSLRYDREYSLQALAEFTARNLFGTTSYGLLSARLGETGHKTASLRLIPPQLPFLFIEPQAQILTRERFEISSQQSTAAFLDKRRGAQVMLGATVLNRFEASAGYRFETERFVPKGISNDNAPAANLSGLRLRLHLDTLDAQEFPRSGTSMEIKGDLKTKKLGADLSYSVVQGEIRHHFSPTDRTTFTVRLAAFKSGGILPAFERAYLGGYGFSDTDSYRFVGYERDEFAVPNMAIGGVAYRRQLFARPLGFIGKGYLFAEYNLARMDRAGSVISAYGRTVHGGAIGLALDSMIGPIRLAVGIGEAGKPKFYLSLGLSF